MQIAFQNGRLIGLYQSSASPVEVLSIMNGTDLESLLNNLIKIDITKQLFISKGTYVLKGRVEFPDNFALGGAGSDMFSGTLIIGDDAELVVGDNFYMGNIMLSGTLDIQKKGKAEFENVNDKRSGNVKKVDDFDYVKVNGQLIQLITPHPVTIEECDKCPFCDEDHMHCRLSKIFGEPIDSANSYDKISTKCPLFRFTEVPFKLTKEARDKIKYEMEHLRK